MTFPPSLPFLAAAKIYSLPALLFFFQSLNKTVLKLPCDSIKKKFFLLMRLKPPRGETSVSLVTRLCYPDPRTNICCSRRCQGIRPGRMFAILIYQAPSLPPSPELPSAFLPFQRNTALPPTSPHPQQHHHGKATRNRHYCPASTWVLRRNLFTGSRVAQPGYLA